MCRFHKFKFIILLILFLCNRIYGQQRNIDLAVQQGHSADITLIAISDNYKYFATYGKDNKIIIWDYLTGCEMAFRYLNPGLSAMKFGNGKDNIYLQFNKYNTIYKLDITEMELEQVKPNEHDNFRNRKSVSWNKMYVEIDGAKIILRDSATNKIIRTRTSDYFDQPFNSIVYSVVHNRIYAACEDGFIYEFDKELKLLSQLKGHNSGVNDLEITRDEKHLYSVSSDRSVIKWNLNNLKIENRIAGKSFSLYGISLTPSGNKLMFGDEIGFLKTIYFNNKRPEIEADRKFIYPLTYSYQFSDSNYFYSGQDNRMQYVFANKRHNVHNVRFGKKPPVNVLFTRGLGLYRPPFSDYYSIAVSPDQKWMTSFRKRVNFIPNYMVISNVSNPRKWKSSKQLFVSDFEGDSRVTFLNDSTVISKYDSGIVAWRIKKNQVKNIWFKKIVLPFSFDRFVRYNDSILVFYGNDILYFYNLYNEKTIFAEIKKVKSLFALSNELIAFTDQNNHIVTATISSGNIMFGSPLVGHQDSVTALTYHKDRNLIISSSADGTIRVWDHKKRELKISIIPVGKGEYVAVSPDHYYMLSGKTMEAFGFKMGDKFFYPEQFDPFYNRPDIILARLGFADSVLINAYHQAYVKRLKKTGFTEEMLNPEFHLPELFVTNLESIPNSSPNDTLKLNLSMRDDVFPLDRYNIWVNGVPLYGTNGKSLRNLFADSFKVQESIPLANGKNRIQISCMNQKGAESYKITIPEVKYAELKITNPKIYFIGIGIDAFQQPEYNLKYSVKDIRDLTAAFRKKYGNALIVDTIFNANVTLENVIKLKNKLKLAEINSKVIIAYSGHGLLSEKFDYFLSSYGVDFAEPETRGIPYQALENLLDSIPARQKLMLIDACHSGEVDKDELVRIKREADSLGLKGVDVVAYEGNESGLGLQNSFELMQELFVNVGKGTGATIISASGGTQFALEKGDLKNGVFTYSILEAIKNNPSMTVSQLKTIVGKRVVELTNGMQKPTSRNETINSDWRVW